jgi:hypothetical protein
MRFGVVASVGSLRRSIPWILIAWVWIYNIAWMFVPGGVRLLTGGFAAVRTTRQVTAVVNQPLRLHAAS